MTVQDLMARFPAIPRSLHDEPLLTRFAAAFSSLLVVAQQPSACSTSHSAENHYYLNLVGPLAIHGYGLSSREKVLGQIQELLDRQAADAEGFAASLLPADTSATETKGPGCS